MAQPKTSRTVTPQPRRDNLTIIDIRKKNSREIGYEALLRSDDSNIFWLDIGSVSDAHWQEFCRQQFARTALISEIEALRVEALREAPSNNSPADNYHSISTLAVNSPVRNSPRKAIPEGTIVELMPGLKGEVSLTPNGTKTLSILPVKRRPAAARPTTTRPSALSSQISDIEDEPENKKRATKRRIFAHIEEDQETESNSSNTADSIYDDDDVNEKDTHVEDHYSYSDAGEEESQDEESYSEDGVDLPPVDQTILRHSGKAPTPEKRGSLYNMFTGFLGLGSSNKKKN